MPWYIDSSGLMKLCIRELESHELREFVQDRALIVSELAVTELVRGARRQAGTEEPARALLRRIALVELDRDTLVHAGNLKPDALRSLDAIHIATALSLREACQGIVTYDRRMQEAARAAGFTVLSPGQD